MPAQSKTGANIYGNLGHNTIDGTDGNDKLYGSGGNDVLHGGKGNDLLSGGPGNDTLYGGDGADNLAGTKGNDLLFGGAGNDRFRWGGIDFGGTDTIGDYEDGNDDNGNLKDNGDLIDLRVADANANRDGNQAFAFGGFSGPVENGVWFAQENGDTIVRIDTDGDTGTVEQTIVMADYLGQLGAEDFLL